MRKRLIKWWYRLIGKQEGRSADFLPSLDDCKVICPLCRMSYDIRSLIPANSSQATIVCSGCGEQIEVYPHGDHGWVRPRAEYREKCYF
jgi:hypothetical protein